MVWNIGGVVILVVGAVESIVGIGLNITKALEQQQVPGAGCRPDGHGKKHVTPLQF